jgi:hypothetical protein
VGSLAQLESYSMLGICWTGDAMKSSPSVVRSFWGKIGYKSQLLSSAEQEMGLVIIRGIF